VPASYYVERPANRAQQGYRAQASIYGNTLAPVNRRGHGRGRAARFAPLLIDGRHIRLAYAYRMRNEGESEGDCRPALWHFWSRDPRLGMKKRDGLIVARGYRRGLARFQAAFRIFKRFARYATRMDVL